MVSTYYTVQELTKFYQENDKSQFLLNEKTKDIVAFILKNIVIPPPEPDIPISPSRPIDKFERFSAGKRSSHIKKSRATLDWEGAGSFKPTQIKSKEGIEKNIDEFRILLNKISSKNYETQKESIISKMEAILSLDSTEDPQKIAGIIFDIASTNKFYSELYADLYVELIGKFSIFSELLDGFIQKYTDTLYKIHYVDHNVDYDGFCNYTKTNDLRKAMASFIINLMKKGVLEKQHIQSLITDIQKLLSKYMAEDDRTNEVDEIIENMFLFITMSKKELENGEEWGNNILPFVRTISKMKSKEQKSLSSRAIFKCMDILDKL